MIGVFPTMQTVARRSVTFRHGGKVRIGLHVHRMKSIHLAMFHMMDHSQSHDELRRRFRSIHENNANITPKNTTIRKSGFIPGRSARRIILTPSDTTRDQNKEAEVLIPRRSGSKPKNRFRESTPPSSPTPRPASTPPTPHPAPPTHDLPLPDYPRPRPHHFPPLPCGMFWDRKACPRHATHAKNMPHRGGSEDEWGGGSEGEGESAE